MVISELFDCSQLQDAVIEALWIDAGPERFVTSYGGEQALYDVIAAPRIIEFSFSSREEAAASMTPCRPAGAA